jgi:hypothetical protein
MYDIGGVGRSTELGRQDESFHLEKRRSGKNSPQSHLLVKEERNCISCHEQKIIRKNKKQQRDRETALQPRTSSPKSMRPVPAPATLPPLRSRSTPPPPSLLTARFSFDLLHLVEPPPSPPPPSTFGRTPPTANSYADLWKGRSFDNSESRWRRDDDGTAAASMVEKIWLGSLNYYIIMQPNRGVFRKR